MLSPFPMVSSIGCLLLYDPCFQFERDDLIVTQLPYLATAIPLPARLLHLLLPVPLSQTNAYPHDRVIRKTWRWRFPGTLCPDELDSLEPLLPLRIVAIAHTDEPIPILGEQSLAPSLAGIEG